MTRQEWVRFKGRRSKEKGSSCWRWTGRKNKHGYGVFVRGHRRAYLAHRVAYEHFTGAPIPGGLCVLHRCDVRDCVRPSHLFLGTQADNVADMVAKGRRRGGNVQGSANPMAKLTPAKVAAIRNKYVPRSYTLERLAGEYGVSIATISFIVNGKRWAARCG